MDTPSSVRQEIPGTGGTRYTVSLTARACLQALQLAAWIEAMLLAHRAAAPHGAGSWLWFLGRCVLFTFGVHVVVSVMAEITKRRTLRGGATGHHERKAPEERQRPVVQPLFDLPAFEATASALLFHAGPPLWLWIFA